MQPPTLGWTVKPAREEYIPSFTAQNAVKRSQKVHQAEDQPIPLFTIWVLDLKEGQP